VGDHEDMSAEEHLAQVRPGLRVDGEYLVHVPEKRRPSSVNAVKISKVQTPKRPPMHCCARTEKRLSSLGAGVRGARPLSSMSGTCHIRKLSGTEESLAILLSRRDLPPRSPAEV